MYWDILANIGAMSDVRGLKKYCLSFPPKVSTRNCSSANVYELKGYTSPAHLLWEI